MCRDNTRDSGRNYALGTSLAPEQPDAARSVVQSLEHALAEVVG
jgi:hypothetical protein